MKILIISRGAIPHIGGKSTHILDLVDGFNSLGISTKVFSYSSIDKITSLIINVIYLPLKIINNNFATIFKQNLYDRILRIKIDKYTRYNKIDYISAQDPGSVNIIGRIKRLHKTPVIMTMHSYFGIGHNEFEQKYFIEKSKKDLMSLKYVDMIITVDQRIKRHVEEIVESVVELNKEIKIDSIMNFTNIVKYYVDDEDNRNHHKQKFGLNKDDIVILCVRRLVAKNGVIEAVKAVSKIERSNIILLIAGDGPESETIEKYIADNKLEKKVKLLGNKSGQELRDLYSTADIAIVPSITVNGLQEATSISAIEAMACGLPTIASNIGGLSQLIENDCTGILVPEKNPLEISNAILRIIDDPDFRDNISANAREYIVNHHSHIEASKKYLEKFLTLNAGG